jgi:hypothetical protein
MIMRMMRKSIKMKTLMLTMITKHRIKLKLRILLVLIITLQLSHLKSKHKLYHKIKETNIKHKINKGI